GLAGVVQDSSGWAEAAPGPFAAESESVTSDRLSNSARRARASSSRGGDPTGSHRGVRRGCRIREPARHARTAIAIAAAGVTGLESFHEGSLTRILPVFRVFPGRRLRGPHRERAPERTATRDQPPSNIRPFALTIRSWAAPSSWSSSVEHV